MNFDEKEQTWFYVAVFDGKKVKKLHTTMKEFIDIEWITKIKFSFHDDGKSYCEGIVLAEADDKKSLEYKVSKKPLRVPHNTFRPFPDLNVKPSTMLEKWKKRLATIALNDTLRNVPALEMNEEISMQIPLARQLPLEKKNNKIEEVQTSADNQRMDYSIDPEKIKQQPGKELFNSVVHQPNDKQNLFNLTANQPIDKLSSELSNSVVDQSIDKPSSELSNTVVNQPVDKPSSELSSVVVNQSIDIPMPEKSLSISTFHRPNDNDGKQNFREGLQSLNRGKLSSTMSCARIQLSPNSQNVADYAMDKRRMSSYSDSDDDSVHNAFLVHQNESRRAEKCPLSGGMVRKKKYVKLRQKYDLLKAMLNEQKQHYAKDLKIQYYCRCLHEAIKDRYSSDDEKEDL